MGVAVASREDWIGRTGQEWARRQEALERLLGPAGSAGLTALNPRPGERIVDIGCGAGASAAALAEAVAPNGHVLAVDVSPDLVSRARGRLAPYPHAEVVEADAQHLDLGEGAFDALYSRFGAMFFDHPPTALRNLHRSLRPGVRAVFVAWRPPERNQWASVPMTFSTDGLADPGRPAGAGPFAWADPGVFRPLLEGAGFHDVRVETSEYLAEIADGDDPDPLQRAIDFMLRIGPLASRLRGTPDAARREAEVFLKSRLARHVQDGAVRLLASAWIIEARA